MNVPPGTHRGRNGWRWSQCRRDALERYGYRCASCGRAGHLEVDHVVPVQRGGTDDPHNLRPLCVPCHKAKTAADKHGRDADLPGKREWLERMGD